MESVTLSVAGELVTTGTGTTCRLHRTGGQRGFVYALGHRVYGRLATTYSFEQARHVVTGFKPHGKWAFTISGATTAAPQHAGV